MIRLDRELSASVSSLSLLPILHQPPSVSNNLSEKLLVDDRGKKPRPSRGLELKVRRLNAKCENLEKDATFWKRKFFVIKEKHRNVSKNASMLKKENEKLSFALNFHKRIASYLNIYRSQLSGAEKLKYAAALFPIQNDYKRAPTGCRNPVSSYYKRTLVTSPQKCTRSKMAQIKSKILEFYLDDENSVASPGKKEFITRKKVKKGKRYLTDTLTNLHSKFCKINNVKMSRAVFFQSRPFWVVRAKIATRDTCLCKEHTNFKFLIEKLHHLKIINTRSSTGCLQIVGCEILTQACVDRSCTSCKISNFKISEDLAQRETFYYEWIVESQSREGAGGKIYTVNITIKKKVTCIVSKLVEHFWCKLPIFLKHVYLVTHQHQAFRTIKLNLDFDEVVLAFDFSTNYVGKCREEIQSSNYGASKQQISLRTGIFYYRDKGSNLMKHVSFGSICDFLQHDAAAASAYMEPVFAYLLELIPQVKIIHFMSDGPTSQYKNKRFLYLFRYFSQKLNLEKATQNYSAPGHGKGGPDAEGAVLKGQADEAVMRGIDVMCAHDMTDVVRGNPESKIKVFKIEKDDVKRLEKLIPETLEPVKKILSAYQITWVKSKPLSLNLKTFTCAGCDQLSISSTSVCDHYNLYDYEYSHKVEEQNRLVKNLTLPKTTATSSDELEYKL